MRHSHYRNLILLLALCGSLLAACSAPAPQPVTPPPAPAVAPEPVPPPPPIPVIDTKNVTIPAGTEITVRMIDSVDSATAHVGEAFHASVDQPLTINNDVVLQKGSDVYVKLMEVSSAGSLRGKSELQLALDRIFIGKKSYTVVSNVFENSGGDQGKKAVRNGVIGAAIGAAIGAIAGGGKGAAIGAGAGAGGGVGVSVLTKGEQVRVPSETRLVFSLSKPLEVTVPNNPASSATTGQDFSSGPRRLEAPPESSDRDNRFGPYPGTRRERRP